MEKPGIDSTDNGSTKTTELLEVMNPPYAEELVELQKSIDAALGGLRETFRSINAAFEPTRSMMQAIMSINSAILTNINDSVEAFSKAFTSSMSKTLDTWRAAAEVSRYHIRLYRALNDMQWTPVYEQDDPFWANIVEAMMGKEDLEETAFRIELNKVIKTYFKTIHTASLVVAWDKNPLMRNRICVVKQAVQAHKRGLFYVSVPVLIIQIEGLLWDAINVGNEAAEAQINKYRNKYSRISNGFPAIKKPISIDIVEPSVERSITDLFQKEDLVHDLDSINRHRILHGADCSYGTWDTSGRLIVLLDTLQLLLYEYTKEIHKGA